jgi:hypothetical protein
MADKNTIALPLVNVILLRWSFNTTERNGIRCGTSESNTAAVRQLESQIVVLIHLNANAHVAISAMIGMRWTLARGCA